MITLKQLHYFAAVARHRHFGRAAVDCHVSQPALSVQVQDLEAQLGVALLERRRHAVTLTRMGAEIERRAQAILADVRDLADFARHRPAVLAGPLRLGIIPSIAPYLLPSVLPLLQSRFPGLDLTLREAQTRMLVDDLKDGQLDVALLSLPLAEPWAETAHVFDDAFLLVTAAGRAVPAFERVNADLGGETLLLLEEGHCLRDQALQYCRSARPGRQGRFGAASLSTIVQMVANGYGATLLPEIALPVEAHGNPAVAARRFADPQPSRAVGLMWRRSSPRRADFLELGAIIAEARQSLAV